MADLKGRVSSLEITVEKLLQKVDDFIAELRRTADRQDARMEKLEQSMNITIHQIHNLVIAAIIGIGDITASVIAFVAAK